MVVFIDTSAFLNVIDADSADHSAAVSVWQRLLHERAAMRTTDYVRLEAWSLIQARFGLPTVGRFDRDCLSVVEIFPVTESQFAAAKTLVLSGNRRGFSLVDAASFTAKRDEAIDTAFAYDRHFREQGFKVL